MNRLQKSWFLMHLHICCQTKHWSVLQLFQRSNWIWRVMAVGKTQKILPINVQECSRSGFHVFFLFEKFQTCQNVSIWNLVFSLAFLISSRQWNCSFKDGTNTTKFLSFTKCLEQVRMFSITLRRKDLVSILQYGLGNRFLEVALAMNLEWCWEKRHLTNQGMLTIFTFKFSAYTLLWYTQTWLSDKLLMTQEFCCLFSGISKLNAGINNIAGQYKDNQTLSLVQVWPLQKVFPW